MRITREMLREWSACYDDERIAALVPPDGVTPLEVCDAPIPAAARDAAGAAARAAQLADVRRVLTGCEP